MDSIRRFLGLDTEGRGVSPSTSLLYSMVVSILVSVAVRLVFPSMSYPLRFVIFFVVVFFIFRWIGTNRSKNTKN